MENYHVLYQAVAALCLTCCGLSNASPTLIPPTPPAPSQMGGEELGYLLTMPQTLQAGSREQYCVTLQGNAQDTTITLELLEVEKGIVDEFTHTYVNGESQCNTFTVPNEPGTYEVNLQDDTRTLATSQVQVLGNNLITFVQTDKPMYKPGQTVKFRILTMTRNLRARVGEIETVFIKDPNSFKVKQYKNVESEGMASLEFQLISDAKLGTWAIEVTMDGEVTTQHFKVEEYVLPRFEVTVEPPSYFLVTSETFDGTICAKYTYGKPVKGFLTVQVCPSGYGAFGQACAIRQTQIDGCHKFSINSSEILSTDRYFYGRSFSIDASVREADTGVQVNGTAQGPEVSYDPLKMEFLDDTNGYFKPGLPVYGKVKVSKPDGSPAEGEDVLVTARDHSNSIYLEKVFKVNELGEIHYSVCQGVMENTSSLSMFAEAKNFKVNEEASYGRRLYTPTAHGSFRQWFSPSFSYIQIPSLRAPIQCGEELSLNIPFTHDGSKPYVKFHYQVMSRGRIVHTGTTTAPTLPRPLDFMEPLMEHCLEVGEEPTRPPLVTDIPEPRIYENMTDSSEMAPRPPVMVGEPEAFDESSLSVVLPPERTAAVAEVYNEPEMVTAPELPLLEPMRIEPISESLDLGDEQVRRKRSIMPPFGGGEEEKIVRSESISDQVSSVQLDIPVTAEMSPSFSILLFYVRDDGETVADSMEFSVEPCFQNEVKMEFADKTVAPGEQTVIQLEAAAGSVCGVGVVDKSINILGGDHQITPAQVFEKLKEYSLSSRNRYTYFRNDNNYCKEKMEKKAKLEAAANRDGEEGEEEEDAEEGFVRFPDYWYRSNYVDAIEAFKQMGMLVLTNLAVETRPCAKDIPVYYAYAVDSGIPGPVASVIQDSEDERGLQVPLASAKADVRSHFPETWLWDLFTLGESGARNISVTVPDTITQWVGNSLCINEKAGFGLSSVTSLTTFQPFFLSFNLPYNAVRGERLPITVTIYNYLDKCLHMQLRVDGKKGFKVHGARANRDPFCLCGGLSKTTKFFITAQDIGKLPIFAQAEIVPGECGNSVVMDTQYVGMTDAVQREVLVKAEGVTQRYSHSHYICPTGDEMYRDNFRLPLPSDMVPDSARGDVTVIGDIMGPALSNLDGLVRMPTGCGEQNMVGFTPNIYVLKYLTATGRLTEVVQDKAKNFMEIGYQRELKYRHSDGSYSAYGEKGNKPGSTWLTAFVVKSFAQARPYIFIDEDDLNLSMDYLKSVQNPEEGPLTGCFFENGEVFSSYMQGGLGRDGNDAALSAYVLIALLEGGLTPEDASAVDAIDCINRQLSNSPQVDVYSLSLVAYVNALYNSSSPVTTQVMDRLNNATTVSGDLKYWKRRGEQPKPVNSWYYYSAPSAEVEMTAYGLLATLKFYDDDAIGKAQSIAFWLSSQQSAFGGFSSTQDTVLGLNALSEFAELAYSDAPTDLELMVGVTEGAEFQKIFMVTDDNSLELQRHTFDMTDNAVMLLSATGTGCALLQANVRYNKMPDKLGIDDPKFQLRVDPRLYQHDRNQCGRRTIYVTFGQSNSEQFSTGMTMLTVRMVTGWSAIPESLRELRSRFALLGIERLEEKVEEGVINFYLDQLDTRVRRFALDVEQDRDLLVSAPKPAEVQIYQYYEKDVTVIKSYELRTTCGTKEELSYDEPEDDGADDNGFVVQRRQPIGGAPVRIGASVSQPQANSNNCPVCDLETAPPNYNEIICNSTVVYKVRAGRNKKYSMKIKANLRPIKKVRLNLFANVRMDSSCKCPLLQKPLKTVLILTKATNLQGKTMTLDARTYVFSVRKDRTLERKARKAQRKCRMP
ncbi:alpha-2-macroglobulin-like protein 1 isoform X1 [Littorina saxatilis]|uniref:alpha-2-macroglobulin-like protein 1 isoform X1 n=1 Tax=Littorina saxatilis TaxID=31220 RepID=UPI0038B5394A